ncbi:hypothetical protein BDV29DRAFT_201366 [Aspergillus leporis]|uniref:Rhodopsin domain-containing protein n=1 Tax=Aspergillus leporis TaxID=41062 RepID=A0A5N5X0Y3_9EURO|nr:hypothetical protein BDV29DRAFT_201366 [Aspergillus leporis]
MISIAPGSQQDLQIGSYVIFGAAMVMAGLRLYARQFLLGKLGSDDVLIVLASLVSIGELVTVPRMYECGVGLHLIQLIEEDQECTRKWAWVSQVLYFLSLGMVALYLRLASNKTHIRFLYGVGAIILGHGITATFVASFICEPISVLWSPEFPRGCLDRVSFNYFNGAFHITTDIILALLPIPIVKKLQTNNRQKRTGPPLSSPLASKSTCPHLRFSLFKVYFGSTGLTNKRAYELENRYTHGSGARKALNDFSNVEETRRQTRTNTVSSSCHSPESYDSVSEIAYGQKDGVVQTTEFWVSYSRPSGNCASLV